MSKLNVNRSSEDSKKPEPVNQAHLEWALEQLIEEMSPEDKQRLEEVIQERGVEFLREYIDKKQNKK